MNIVIVGAGGTGSYLARLLSSEKHNVIVIDRNERKLEQLALTCDVATRAGSAGDWQLLDDLLELSPDMLIALTDDDDANLVACSLAKQLGYPTTIARVHDTRFLNRTRLDFGRVFDVDYFICPELLAANEILKYIVSEGSLTVEYFAHGACELRTFQIPPDWARSGVTLSKLGLPEGVMVGLIYRGKKEVIFPHGADDLRIGDEVTFIGEVETIEALPKFFGVKKREIRSVVIVGGSPTGYQLARLLEKRNMGIRLIEKDYDRAAFLAEHLSSVTIVNHDALDIHFLLSEKINQADLVVSCMGHDETNLFMSLLAKEIGCDHVLMLLENQAHLPILQKLGISHAVSPILCASSRILSHVVTGSVNSLISLYENQAEIVEITVPLDSKITGIPLADLGPILPKDMLIAVIQNRGRIMIAHGSRILSPGDIVILITSPQHLSELEKIF
jgi:trk system potassium uptake protein TrkA